MQASGWDCSRTLKLILSSSFCLDCELFCKVTKKPSKDKTIDRIFDSCPFVRCNKGAASGCALVYGCQLLCLHDHFGGLAAVAHDVHTAVQPLELTTREVIDLRGRVHGIDNRTADARQTGKLGSSDGHRVGHFAARLVLSMGHRTKRICVGRLKMW